ncbi:multidrug resistance efflux transporter family protein [Fictibacillus iocasae]|uniref:Multidrug resistance efflux transporter family protein n=1 Tax=Fictibacillus iocasae TaxID=2715437 RepID=A0ABW2NLI3_9BACL
MKAIVLGVLAALFFGVTFVLNRTMEQSGGSWPWTSSLRFFYMVPLLWGIVWLRGNVAPVLKELKQHFRVWFLWSTVGFVLFYAPITFAAGFGPAWLVASTWQITIIAGSLLVPLFIMNGKRQSIPLKGLLFSSIILAGVLLVQWQEAQGGLGLNSLYCVLAVLVAAFAYPLGNRKMMQHTNGRLDAFQRALGMTIASLPIWLVLAAAGFVTSGPPSSGQLVQTVFVAVSSGVIATVLFFKATDLCGGNPVKLAAVEATQSAEIVFVLAAEILFLSLAVPNAPALAGMALIMMGMYAHAMYSAKVAAAEKLQKRAG